MPVKSSNCPTLILPLVPSVVQPVVVSAPAPLVGNFTTRLASAAYRKLFTLSSAISSSPVN